MMRDATRGRSRRSSADDGAVFVEIDDTELGAAASSSMDAVFGRAKRYRTITVVRSARDRAQGDQPRAR